jgi:tRNA (cmo5U34)-methyltransferase
MVPGRDEALALIARLAVWRQPSCPRVLDLGCGTGEASAAVLALAPEASITMVDFSDEMLRRAAARFAGDARARLLKHDLGEGLPEPVREGPFDAVVSCFAFHHVAPARRVVAYQQIHAALVPDGVFVNGDRVVGESPVLAAREMDAWAEWMAVRAREQLGVSRSPAQILDRQREMDQRLGDQPGSLWAMRDELTRAGFAHVDCVYKNQVTAVVVALKSA